MFLVYVTAGFVGGATIFGAVLGFVFEKASRKNGSIILAVAAGIMLAASVTGLILPALEGDSVFIFPSVTLGIFSGAFLMVSLDKIMKITEAPKDGKISKNNGRVAHRVMLFVLAIAIHNFPEGLAAGVGFGAGNVGDALLIAGGIALQNIPEGMVIVSPLIDSGVGRLRAFFYAALTGVIEIVGTLIGYFAVRISSFMLPFVLSFAGGTMLYVISDDVIPTIHSEGSERITTFALLMGFCIMLAANYYF